MSKESKQILFDQIGSETQKEGITKIRVRNAFTSLNEEKMENDGSNLSNEEIQSLQSVLGINQAPSSRIIQIGEISAEDFSVTVGLFNDDYNQWIINNNIYQNFVSTTLSIDELIDSSNLRYDSIYANTSNTFQVLKGTEGESPIRPVNTDESLLWLTDILVTDSGINVDQPIDLSGFIEKEEESWKTIYTGSATSFSIDYTDKRTRFKINTTVDIPKTLTAINFLAETNRAVEFWVYNNTNLNINIPTSSTSGLSKGFSNINTPFTILPKAKALLKYNPETNLIECWKDNALGGLSSVSVGTDLTGNGTSVSPLNLSASKNAEISGKTTMTDVQSWVTSQSYATNIDLTSGLANRYQITTTNITAPDATYKYAIITDSSGVTRRLDLATYLNANFATQTALTNAVKSKVQITATSNITSDTLDAGGLSMKGRSANINNGANNITFTVNSGLVDILVGMKTGSGTVTFNAGSGVTLIGKDNGTFALDGIAGGQYKIEPTETSNVYNLYITTYE